MVNEINKPTTETIENEALRLRMENANRNVQSMQQEHDELLREMETLRQRAAELSLRQTQENLRSNISTNNEIQIVTNQNIECENTNPEEVTTETAEQLQVEAEATNLPSADNESNNEPTAAKIETEEDPENAEYIRQKIEEIAALKAQFKRVQHMVNTSNLIEEHLSHGIPSQEEVMLHPSANNTELDNTTEAAATTGNDFDISAINYERLLNTSTTVNDDTQEKEELLRAMLSMFNDFTTDLRDQATTLRAERDRLRALRDEILSRRRQQS